LLIYAKFKNARGGVAIFAKDFPGLSARKIRKKTQPPMPSAAPIRAFSIRYNAV
jgi:hypothetical protein